MIRGESILALRSSTAGEGERPDSRRYRRKRRTPRSERRVTVLPSIVAALSPASIRRNASSNGAEAQNARVHAKRGPTVTVLAPTTAAPLHRLQSAAIAARPSAISRLKIAPAGGATSTCPGG